MRKLGALVIGSLVTFAACTQDFDQFHVGDTGGSSGAAGSSSGGSAGLDASSGSGGGGTAGTLPDAGDAGADAGCPSGTKLCGGSCVGLDDPNFGCAGTSCTPCSFANAGAACDAAGQCTISQCHVGYSDCNIDPSDGCEAQPDVDPDNCGACGTVCVLPNASAACVNAGCTIASCNTGYTNCNNDPVDGCEVNTASNPAACGSCTNNCAAQPGTWVCQNGSCTISQCPTGKAECDANLATVCETDTTNSLLHCGFCNNPCNLANATAQCSAGTCSIKSCDAGFADCDNIAANGCEADLSKNTAHCGACNRGCSSTNAGTIACNAGVCTSSCSPGFGNCSQPTAPTADDGCESNLLADPSACGACGRPCSATQVAGPICSAGKCESLCKPGFGNCSTPLAPTPDDGCETSVGSDTANCGACGRTCSTTNVQQAACSGGVCTSSCSNGFSNCTTPAAPGSDDGCETNTASDVNNCGSCNRACSSASVAVKSCNLGVCNSTCSAGFSNCAQPSAPSADDGCETNTAGDINNCGECGRKCSSTNVQAQSCTAGVCNSSCKGGFGNCVLPGAPAADDGCETNVDTSTANCGACNRACSSVGTAALSCAGGQCNSSCSGTLGNCAQPTAPTADDGCETNLATNTSHCGGCGRACSTANTISTSCSAGSCNSYCVTGWANCTQPAAPTSDNGCELDARQDDTHCGSCTNSCTAQNGMVCGDDTLAICGCNSNADCQTGGDSGTCSSSGVCVCPGITSETCRPGEVCVKPGISGNHDCSCNGGPACSTGQVCCQTPAGCFNLMNDAQNCGACGHACPPGSSCTNGNCL